MKKWNLFKEFIIINIGIIIVAAAVFFFLMASHLSVGSISGLAIVLGTLSLLMLGFLIFGRNPKGGGKYRR